MCAARNVIIPGCILAGLLVAVLGCSSDNPTSPPHPPAPVHDLFIAVSDTTSMLLTWTATGARDTLGTAAGYDLRFAAADTTTWERMTPVPVDRPPKAAGEPESLRVSGLSPETQYVFQVQVVAPDSTRSQPSNRAAGVTGTPDRTPPGPTGLVFVRATESSITIGWTATGDDGQLGTAARYELRVRPAAETEWRSIDGLPSPKPAGQHEEFTVIGLGSETLYRMELIVIDDAGNRAGAEHRPVGSVAGCLRIQSQERFR